MSVGKSFVARDDRNKFLLFFSLFVLKGIIVFSILVDTVLYFLIAYKPGQYGWTKVYVGVLGLFLTSAYHTKLVEVFLGID